MLQYTIRAQVFDIRFGQHLPKKDDKFLVDSNVWYWYSYFDASKSDASGYQIKVYPRYINKAFNAQAQLHRCELSLSELTHLIEKAELDTFCKKYQDNQLSLTEDTQILYQQLMGLDSNQEQQLLSQTKRLKIFRHNSQEQRQQVIKAIQFAWKQITRKSQPLDTLLCKAMTQHILDAFVEYAADGYDYFMVREMNDKQILKVITDDGDFATVPGIQVFTANSGTLTKIKPK